MPRREKEKRNLAQRRRDAKGRKRTGRFDQRNTLPKSSPLRVLLPHFFLLLCAFASLREIAFAWQTQLRNNPLGAEFSA